MKKSLVLIIILINLFFSLNLILAEEEITFFAFGHVYVDYDILEKSIPLIIKEKPDFVIFLGDSVSNNFGNTWGKLNYFIEQIQKEGIKIYFVAGNHDILEKEEDKQIFLEKTNNSLYQEFNLKNTTFIIMNSNTEKSHYYDISKEQIDSFKSLIIKDHNKKFIFVHHCLFYQDNKELCNERGNLISKKSFWNSKLVPLIKDEVDAVFLGDLGGKEPYLSYKEDNVNYYGVGFSENNLKIPPHMLKVQISPNELKIEPILLVTNLTSIFLTEESFPKKSLLFKAKKFYINNLQFFTIFLFILIIILTILSLKNKFFHEGRIIPSLPHISSFV